MSKTSAVQIRFAGTAAGDRIVRLPESLVRKKNIPLETPIQLRFGALTAQVTVAVDGRANEMKMGGPLARKTGIPVGSKLLMDYRLGTIKFGPLIGVLMSRVYRKTPGRPFGSNEDFCRELYDTCRTEGGFVYFFTPNEIEKPSATISGWIPHGQWKRGVFPVPDVIYNRLTTRRLENKPSVRQFIKEAKQRYQTQIFNEKFLDKSEVFQALGGDSTLLPFLPESHALKNSQRLLSMLSKYPTVFLKPIRGSLGKGIIRVARTDKKTFLCQTMGMSGARSRIFRSTSTLVRTLSARFKAGRYQIQQGIDIAQMRNRPIDFRALVQKNRAGEWELTSIVARVAGNNHFVSNLARGGTLYPVRTALRLAGFPPNIVKSVHSRLKNAALQLAKGLDQRLSYHFGELGVDLAVDKKGKVWLLEINSKPSKNDNTSMNTGKARPSVRKVVSYARFLADL